MNDISFDMIVETISKKNFVFDNCDINMDILKILSVKEKNSVSPSEIIFADIIKAKLNKKSKFPVVLKIFIDDPKINRDTFHTQKQRDIYDDVVRKIKGLGDGLNGLKYEIAIYKSLFNIIKNNICPNFIPYVGSAQCNIKTITKSIPHDKRDAFLDGLMFARTGINLPVNILITGRPSNTLPLSAFLLDKNISSRDKNIVILQCLYTLYVLKQEKIRHNDLHFGNIIVSINENPVKRLYIVNKNKENWFYINTKYIPLFFDWDLSYSKKIGDNTKLKNYLCPVYNICSKEDEYFDPYTFLCILEDEYCKSKDKDPICEFTKSSFTGKFEDFWEQGFYCRAYKTLNLTQIRPIDTLISNKLFKDFIYKEDTDKVDQVYGYPEMVQYYLEQKTQSKLKQLLPDSSSEEEEEEEVPKPKAATKLKRLSPDFSSEEEEEEEVPKSKPKAATKLKRLSPILENEEDLTSFNLINAVKNNQYEVVKNIIKDGFDIKKVTDNITGNTPLIIAVNNGYLDIVKLLIDSGVNIEDEDVKHRTSIMIASDKGYLDIVKLLIASKANVNHQSDNELSSLLLVVSKVENLTNYLEIMKELLKAGADINHVNKLKFSALMLASIKGNINTVKFLTEKGADIYLVNNDGDSAIMLARKWRRTDIVNYFMSIIMKTPKKQIDEEQKQIEEQEKIILARIQPEIKKSNRDKKLRELVINNQKVKNALQLINSYFNN